MVKYAVVLVALLGVLIAVLWALQRRLIYLPSGGGVPPAAEVIDGARDVSLDTSDGLSLRAWFIPAAAPETDFVVLVANGNAGDRSLRAPLAGALADEGFAVLLFDYRGFGGNPGHPSEEGLALDVRAARRFLIDRGFRDDRVLYFGESLGAAVVTELATEHPPAGLVLRSPFTDLASVGRVHYPVVDHIVRVTAPTAVVYGTSDGIVPPEQSRAVADAAGGPTTVVEVEGADHNDLALLNGEELIDAVVDLARQSHGRGQQ